jgi:sulfur carrier protein
MSIVVNGEPRAEAPPSLAALCVAEGVDPARKGVAIALNGRVVRRDQWAATPLAEGDRVEIVRAVPGG